MPAAGKRECPDCRGTLCRIRLIDKTHYQAHAELEYTVPAARRSFWMGQYPVEGRVVTYMCGECGRLLLYGVPYHDPEEADEGT